MHRTCNKIGGPPTKPGEAAYAGLVSRPVPAAEAGDIVEAVLTRLRSQGGRATSARRLLLAALARQGGHLTAEHLAAAVQAESPDVNLSTIYRNLDELRRLGVIQAHIGRGPASYHLSAQEHGHLICEDCGTLIEVPDQIFAQLVGQIRIQFGFSIDPHRFAVVGRCARCRHRAGGTGREPGHRAGGSRHLAGGLPLGAGPALTERRP